MDNLKIVNDIVFNETAHIVSIFKDYLILDELTEFLKRFYGGGESRTKLRKLIELYTTFFKVFPNYISLRERKYMYKNIERKQRIIDEKQQHKARLAQKDKHGKYGKHHKQFES